MSAPLTESERAALAALGYSEAWLESGLLDRALLSEQYARLQAGGSAKTGGYRGRALTAWREARQSIDDAELDALLSLLEADPDAKMVRAAMAELIQSPQISLDQLARVARADPKLVRRHEDLIRRSYFLRRLDEGVGDELFTQVIESRDAALHTALIRDPRLSRKHAEQLAQRGANPTIRERAQAWAQDKKAWR